MQQFARCPVQLHDGAARIHDQQCIGHGREDRLELQRAPFMLQRALLGSADTGDGAAGLYGDGAQRHQIRRVVGFRLIALRRQHAQHALARQDRHDDA